MFELEKEIIENRKKEIAYCKNREGKCGDDIETGRKECPFLKQFEGCVLYFGYKPYMWPMDLANNMIEGKERRRADND